MTAHPIRTSLPALTGARFFAAVAVVFHHFGQHVVPAGPLRNLVASGFVGVDLFFILSGFVLVYVYRPGEGTLRARPFLAARFARVFPLYALGLVLAAPTYFAAMTTNFSGPPLLLRVAGSIVLHLSMTHAWVGHVGVWNVPDWSLSTEWFFYLTFPWLIPRVIRTKDQAQAVIWIALLIVVGVGVAFAHHAWHPEWVHRSDPGTHVGGMLKYSPLRIHEFLVGALLGRFWLLHGRIPHAPLLVFLSSAAVLAILATGALPMLPLNNGLLAPLFCVLVLGLSEGVGVVARLLSTRIMVRLGEASYGVYILHWPVALWFVQARSASGGPRDTSGSGFWVYLAVVIIASLLAYQLIELPLRGKLRRLLEGASSRPRANSG